MQLDLGDLWKSFDQAYLLLITTNGVVTKGSRPGAGLGKLPRDLVLPLLEPLPDTVTVRSWREP